jgi:uncharacterized protein (DUF1330 family)
MTGESRLFVLSRRDFVTLIGSAVGWQLARAAGAVGGGITLSCFTRSKLIPTQRSRGSNRQGRDRDIPIMHSSRCWQSYLSNYRHEPLVPEYGFSVTVTVVPFACRFIGMHNGRIVMKSQYPVALTLVAGVAMGALAVEVLHAQSKAIYTVATIQISDPEAYMKEFAPKAQAALKTAGSQFLAGGPPTIIDGDPPSPNTRITVRRYNSIEEAKAAYGSAEYKEVRKIGDKYAKFRVFAVEAVSQ